MPWNSGINPKFTWNSIASSQPSQRACNRTPRWTWARLVRLARLKRWGSAGGSLISPPPPGGAGCPRLPRLRRNLAPAPWVSANQAALQATFLDGLHEQPVVALGLVGVRQGKGFEGLVKGFAARQPGGNRQAIS